jgi:beta-lactamase superfamily II metal-dependent hydrolase
MRTARLLTIATCCFSLFVAFAFAQEAEPPGDAVRLQDVDLDETRLRVHFIDIGPGLAALIQTPNDNRHIFIDGGKWGVADMETYVENFVDPDESNIDIAIVTHPDYDHYKGMERILDKYEVGEFWYTGYESEELPDSWDTFVSKIESEEDCTMYWPLEDWVSAGDYEVLDDGGTPDDASDDVGILHLNVGSDPPEVGPVFGRRFSESERRNNASYVFKVIYGDVAFLFTGDINGRDKEHTSEDTENEIDSEELELWTRHSVSNEYSLKSTVIQISHHGSNGSSSLPFLQAVGATWAVIPAGHEHDHPTVSALARIQKAGIAADHILRTDDGDSTPETSSLKDIRGDDSFIFETDGQTITRVLRVTSE